MITWKDISLFTFQRIESINNSAWLSDVDKALYSTCEVFGLTEEQLNNMSPIRANKKISQLLTLMKSDPAGMAKKTIGRYDIIYDPAEVTLGQFIELRHFLQDSIQMGHFAMASLSKESGQQYVTEGHPLRADYFLRQPVMHVIGSLKVFIERWAAFIKRYDSLFGLDKDMYEKGEQSDRFNKQFGWIYSATDIAEHERITLDEAYGLPIIQALNDLAYLKAKRRYEAEQQRRLSQQLKMQ